MTDFASRNFGKWSHKTLGLPPATAERARKIAALALRGATEGERNAAIGRLQAIADQAGVPAWLLLEKLTNC